MNKLALFLVLSVGWIATGRAQETVVTTSADGKKVTYDRTAIDEKGYTRHYVSSTTYVQATPAPTPVPPAMNHSKAGITQSVPAYNQTTAVVAEQPVTVVTGTAANPAPLSASEKARLAAEVAKERAPKKRVEFKNGE